MFSGSGRRGSREESALADEVRTLVRQALRGDEAAMRALVETFQGQVLGLCYHMLGHRQDAEDAAQETFLRALRSLKSWDPAREFRPWLLAIAGNRCRTMLARRRRRPQPASLTEPVVDRRGESEPARLLTEELKLALTTIRDEHRQAFLLFHHQQLSYAEIAEILDCPLGTVKIWVHRARRALVQQLRSRGALEEVRHAERGV